MRRRPPSSPLFPYASLFRSAADRVVVLDEAPVGIVTRADVELARNVLKDVNPENRSFSFHTTRLGLKPRTRRLIPTGRDSTVEQVSADPCSGFHTLNLSLACDSCCFF